MSKNCARLLARSSAGTLRPTKILENVLREHGPQNANDCWKLAEPAGIKSKTHMKSLLRWLVERRRLRLICHHLKEKASAHGPKEFLYGLPKTPTKITPDASSAEPNDDETEVLKED